MPAIIPLAIGGAGFLAGKLAGRKKDPLSAPAPTLAATLTPAAAPPTPPPSTAAAAAAAGTAGIKAAGRQRKRVAAGFQTSKAVPTGAVLGASLQPRALLGY